MAIEMRLDLKLAQKLLMTPQLQQAIKLLQLSRLEMSQLLYQEMLENPVLEDVSVENEPDEAASPVIEEPPAAEGAGDEGEIDLFGIKWDNYIGDDEPAGEFNHYPDSEEDRPSYEQTLSSKESLSEHLLWQLRLAPLTEGETRAGEAIIGNIDDDGYLRDATLPEIAALAGASERAAERALRAVQDMDPPGVGARSLKECLLIQARMLDLGGTIVEQIISGHMADLEKKRYPAIARAVKTTVKDVMTASSVIESLEPKPGRPFTMSDVQYIVPDVFVVKKDGEYVILLNDEGLPRQGW